MLREFIEISVKIVEALSVGIIMLAVTHGTVQFVVKRRHDSRAAYLEYKRYVGKAMLLALEFLVAADIVETVALERTLDSVIVLALLVLVRTFLSWSLSVEIEGRWPWAGESE